MLLSWLLSDTWLMSVPARVADVLLMATMLWLASLWCRSKQRTFGKALLVSSVNGVLGIGLYALFVWVRDTGALPWRGPLWLVEMFLIAQTVLFAILVLADAGTHAMIQRWIPAFAGMTEGGGNDNSEC